jgi:reductive dehalogenase
MQMFLTNTILLYLFDIFLLFFFISSVFEKEKRASIISFVFFIGNNLFWIFLINFNYINIILYLNYFILFIIPVFAIISLIKYFPEQPEKSTDNIQQFDERNHMFSRNNLQFYPILMKKYYLDNPDKRGMDEKIHALPELGEEGATYYDDYYSDIASAGFKVLDRTTFLVNGEKSKKKREIDSEKITEAIKFIAKYYGAVDVGITKLKKYHFYSHHGRREENWGEEIKNTHKYAIVMVVKMNYDMMKHAPSLPIILESSKHYVEAAKIAHIIAEYVRGFGYDARSHVDGNYEVLAVPTARDAGIGEVGRMGILVHPKYGPRIRISIVTTDMELIESPKRKNHHIEEFCKICKKCADNCPTNSISKEVKPYSRGFHHWSIRQETCYAFWKKSGTDCAFCIRSCPYTKKDTLLHSLVRFYISLNPFNQRVALFFDDLFYGRKFKLKKQNPDLRKLL